jgi:hypothetical protein
LAFAFYSTDQVYKSPIEECRSPHASWRPSTKICPESGLSSPMAECRSTVFPEAEAPVRQIIWPRPSLKLMSRNTQHLLFAEAQRHSAKLQRRIFRWLRFHVQYPQLSSTACYVVCRP